jgi:alkanesulfonate monooxygenase SsuD/methylene tetrahydromethanopterin reductase-like flavin-dependent oxidoreductase (luciferase family)
VTEESLAGRFNRPIAVGVTPMETRREVIVHLAQRAERLGYSAFFVAEGWGHDAFALLAEIAARTTTMRIGTNVINGWGRSAATIAMSATTLAQQSGGRFILGLGAGSPALAEGLHNLAFDDPTGRVESVTNQVRRLLDGQRLPPNLHGARPIRLAVTAPARVPITMAALGPRSVGLAARLADYWSPFFLPVSGLAATAEPLARGTEGRPARPLTWPGIPIAVSAGPERARSLAAWWLAFYLTTMGPLYPRTLISLGFGPEVAAVLAANPPGSRPTVPPSRAADSGSHHHRLCRGRANPTPTLVPSRCRHAHTRPPHEHQRRRTRLHALGIRAHLTAATTHHSGVWPVQRTSRSTDSAIMVIFDGELQPGVADGRCRLKIARSTVVTRGPRSYRSMYSIRRRWSDLRSGLVDTQSHDAVRGKRGAPEAGRAGIAREPASVNPGREVTDRR